MENASEMLHLSQEPRFEETLYFEGTRDRAYTVHVDGEPLVSLFSEKGHLFFKTTGGKVCRLDLKNFWNRSSMILASQGGEWVVTADADASVQVLDAIMTREDHEAARTLTAEDAKSSGVLSAQDAVKKAVVLTLGGAVAVGSLMGILEVLWLRRFTS